MAAQNIFQRRFLQDKQFAVSPVEQEDTTISLSKILNLSWRVMRMRFDRLLPIGLLWSGYWVGVVLLDFVLTNFVAVPLINIVVYIGAVFYGVRFYIMWTGTVLRLIRNDSEMYPLQRTDWGLVIRLFLLLCVVALGALIAGLLFVIPGVILMLYCYIGTIIIVDQRVGPMAALARIRLLTKGTRLKYMLWMTTLFAINLIGVIWFVIGLFFTIPLTSIAAIMIYDKLKRLSEQSTQSKPI